MFKVTHKITPKNFDKKLVEKLKEGAILSLAQAMDIVAFMSISKYWLIGKVVKTKSGTVSSTDPAPHPRKLTARSGTLARAIQDRFVFRAPKALKKSEWNIKKGRLVPLHEEARGGGQRQGLREIKKRGKNLIAILSVDDVVSEKGFKYPRVHEFGKRPFLAPALKESRQQIMKNQERILKEIAKEFNMVK